MRKRRIRKIVFWFGGILGGLVLALFILGYFFEDKIHLLAIKELGKALNARIEVEDTDVSFVRSWPDVHVELEGVTINPISFTDNYDVIGLESAHLTINLWSFFSDNMEIHSVRLVEPAADLRRNADGQWNLADLFQPPRDSTKTDTSLVNFDLEDIIVTRGSLRMEDDYDARLIKVDSIHLELDGDFNAKSTHFDTEIALHINQWKDGKMNWVRDKHLVSDLRIDTELGDNAAYRIRESTVKVAAVEMNLGGEILEEGSDFRLNLAYSTSRNDFDAFMSLLPGGLLDTGREYEYDGEFKLHGWVRGLAGRTERPQVYTEYSVKNGAFHYVDYESRLTDVGFTGSCLIAEPAESYFKCENLSASLRGKPVTGNVHYANFADPSLDLKVNGDVALEDVREFYPDFAENSQLNGQVSVNLEVKGRVKDFEQKNYQAVKAKGGLKMAEVRVADERLAHPLERLNGTVKVDNSHIQVDELKGLVGQSDFALRGSITNYLPWFFGENERLRGNVELQSASLNLDDWLLEDSGEENTNDDDRFAFHFPENVDIDVRTRIDEFHFAQFDAKAVDGRCRLFNRRLHLDQLNMRSLSGSISLTGEIHAVRDDLCRFQMDALVNDIDINATFRTFNQLAAFALVEENLFGSFSGDLHLAGDLNQYLDLDPESLYSYGDVQLKEGRLVDFEPLEGLAGFVKLSDLKDIQFSDVSTSFRVERTYFYIPQLSVTANRYQLDVSGQHGFDNTLDYHVAVEMPRKEARRSSSEEVMSLVAIEPEERARIVIPVHITGTADEPRYALDGNFVKESVGRKVEQEKEELRDAFATEVEEEFGGTDTFAVSDLIEVDGEPTDSTDKVGQFLKKLKNPLKKKFPRKGSK